MFGGWQITRTGIVFIVGIIVLAGLVFGGIWLVRDRGEQVRRQEEVKVAEQNLEEQSKTPVAAEAESKSTEAPQAETATDTATTTTSAGELPETGAETMPIIVLALVSLAAGYYLTSRRAVREL